ncbi:MAG: zinc ribbon domain-containing protein [Nitrospinae bacterium]|nr:zinc ribbon domain-containing protein [Nitrospinota bacterium]
MDILGAVIALGAVGAAFFYTIWPIMRPQTAQGVLPDEDSAQPLSNRELTRLLMEREQAYKNIMDIEFDKEMGKLSDEDYAQMMAPARAQAVEVLRRLDARGVKEGMAPVQVTEREAAQTAARLETEHPPPGKVAVEKPLSLDERLEAEILRYRKNVGKSQDESAVSSSDEQMKSMKPRFCASCGNAVDEADNFCSSCGRQLS